MVTHPIQKLLESHNSQYYARNMDLDLIMGGKSPFPCQLYLMLEMASKEGFSDIVGWIHDSSAFKVHRPDLFEEKIMPYFFAKQSQYKSFQRQLNLWGFQRLDGKRGPCKEGYYHQYFQRHDTSQFRFMHRRQPKRVGSRNRRSAVRSIEGETQREAINSLLGVSHTVSMPKITSSIARQKAACLSPSRDDELLQLRSEVKNESKSRIPDRIPFAKVASSPKVLNDKPSMTVPSKATEVFTFVTSNRRTLDEWKYIQIGINLAMSEDFFVLNW